MRVTITSIKPEFDKQNRPISHICFKSFTEGSYDLYTAPHFRNYMRWRKVIAGFAKGCEIELDGLKVKDRRRRLADADSFFYIHRQAWPQDVKSA